MSPADRADAGQQAEPVRREDEDEDRAEEPERALDQVRADDALEQAVDALDDPLQEVLRAARDLRHRLRRAAGEEDQPDRDDPRHDHRVGDRKSEGSRHLHGALREPVFRRRLCEREQQTVEQTCGVMLAASARAVPQPTCFAVRREMPPGASGMPCALQHLGGRAPGARAPRRRSDAVSVRPPVADPAVPRVGTPAAESVLNTMDRPPDSVARRLRAWPDWDRERAIHVIGRSAVRPAGARAGPAGGGDRFDGAAARRDGHRQGALRLADPRVEPAPRPPDGAGELRRDPLDAHRERTVRPREGGVHRRPRAAGRPLRAGEQLHDPPRRDRRPAAGGPGQAAARARGAADRAARKPAVDPGGRAHHRRDAPGPRAADRQRRAFARTCSTASTCSRSACRRCASASRTSRCWRGRFIEEFAQAHGKQIDVDQPRTAWRCSSGIPGPATSASCATSSSAR